MVRSMKNAREIAAIPWIETRDRTHKAIPHREILKDFHFWLASTIEPLAPLLWVPPEKASRTQEGYARVSCELGALKP